MLASPPCCIQNGPSIELGGRQPPSFVRSTDLKLPSLRISMHTRKLGTEVNSIQLCDKGGVVIPCHAEASHCNSLPGSPDQLT